MVSYTQLAEWTIPSTEADDSDAAKLIEVVCREGDDPTAFVRNAYWGESGNFVNNPPTYRGSSQIKEEMLELQEVAFNRAIMYNKAIDELEQLGIDPDRIPGLLELIDDLDDLEKIEALMG
jgi:hypothetical protein